MILLLLLLAAAGVAFAIAGGWPARVLSGALAAAALFLLGLRLGIRAGQTEVAAEPTGWVESDPERALRESAPWN